MMVYNFVAADPSAAKAHFEVSLANDAGDVNISVNGQLVAWFDVDDGKLHLMPGSRSCGLPLGDDGTIQVVKG